MIVDSVHNLTILHYRDGKSNKLWLSFIFDHINYAAWGGMGQSLSFKNHGPWYDSLTSVENSKIKKGYQSVELDQVLEQDPQFLIRFSERFTEFVLKG
jgi:hypothetical protein